MIMVEQGRCNGLEFYFLMEDQGELVGLDWTQFFSLILTIERCKWFLSPIFSFQKRSNVAFLCNTLQSKGTVLDFLCFMLNFPPYRACPWSRWGCKDGAIWRRKCVHSASCFPLCFDILLREGVMYIIFLCTEIQWGWGNLQSSCLCALIYWPFFSRICSSKNPLFELLKVEIFAFII